MQLYGVPNPSGSRGSAVMGGLQPNAGYGGSTSEINTIVNNGDYTGPLAGTSILGTPIAVFVGMVLLLALGKFLSEHDNLPFEPADLHIGPYNILAVGITAVVFITTLKVFANKYPVPGLLQLANFI